MSVARIGEDVFIHRIAVDAAHLAAVVGGWDRPALLEGGPGFGESGRWSFYAAEPRLEFEATLGRGVRVRRDDDPWRHDPDADPLTALAGLLAALGPDGPADADPEAPPFSGGLIGFFGYDMAPALERLPRKAPADSLLPDIRFALYDTAVAVDHRTGRVLLVARDLTGDGEAATRRRLRDWKRRLEAARPVEPTRSAFAGPVASNFRKSKYLDSVDRALEYIRAGDIFQVNLSQRFAAYGRVEPLDLYLALRRASPSPFAAFLRLDDDRAVMSASPELFYRVRGDRIVTRPIKGTRPRGDDPAVDSALADELRRSEKDRAELTMIVDLERNDLGRVAEYGSVRVAVPLVVESYAQVHHLVATVEGRLRPGVGPIDVVRAVFPGGSITGAPKIRAMEIIDELEPNRRSLYTGAIGYFSTSGSGGFNIAIRTMLAEGDRVTFGVGGGIVADSTPEAEYRETLHKGRGMFAVLADRGAR